MKSAMQELIERLEKTNQEYYAKWKAAKGKDKDQWNHAMSVQTISVINAKSLLPKERQQIINARLSVTGLNHASPTDDKNLEDAEQYYNQTFSIYAVQEKSLDGE